METEGRSSFVRTERATRPRCNICAFLVLPVTPLSSWVQGSKIFTVLYRFSFFQKIIGLFCVSQTSLFPHQQVKKPYE